MLSLEFKPPFVSAEWLQARRQQEALVILDASWYLPNQRRDTRGEFDQQHIPGARFFDIDGIADHTSGLPHTLPAPEDFARAIQSLGVAQGDTVVVYDSAGLFSAPRAWWMFRVFGWERVAILQGGLPAWLAVNGEVESTVEGAPALNRVELAFEPALFASQTDVVTATETGHSQILDARSAGRFSGAEPEPRPGLASGHMPGAVNVPFGELIDSERGELLPPEQLQAWLIAQGVDLDKPTITSCGSGITACILALALFTLGRESVAVYDGSWTEWGSQQPQRVVR
jgi:thiosulfate/3-mercaptopyruvate sulfurtransferase